MNPEGWLADPNIACVSKKRLKKTISQKLFNERFSALIEIWESCDSLKEFKIIYLYTTFNIFNVLRIRSFLEIENIEFTSKAIELRELNVHPSPLHNKRT